MNVVYYLLISLLLLPGLVAGSDVDDSQAKTVIGPRNPNLANGAEALLAGNAEDGIRLSKLGLESAVGQRERQAALGNICAGYVMLMQYDRALEYCDQALNEHDRNWRARSNRALIYVKQERYDDAAKDLARAEELAPNARAIKEVRGMFLDATEPVTPTIVIDDRRRQTDDDET